MSTPLNLGHIYARGGRLYPRRNTALLVPGFDEATGDQVILGRRNDNTWEVRSVNPYDANDPALLAHLTYQESNTIPKAHLLYCYPDWATGQTGKTGIANNLYYSTDDCVTWTFSTRMSSVLTLCDDVLVDYHLGNYYRKAALYDGGSSFALFLSSFLGTETANPASSFIVSSMTPIPITRTYNRLLYAATHHTDVSGVRPHHAYAIMVGEDGFYMVRWATKNAFLGAPNTITPEGEFGPYPFPPGTTSATPWEELIFAFSTEASVLHEKVPGSTTLYMKPGVGASLYKLAVTDLEAGTGSWAVAYDVANSPTLTPTAEGSSPADNRHRLHIVNWNDDRAKLFLTLNTSTPPGILAVTGTLTGQEAIWRGVPPHLISATAADGTGGVNGVLVDPNETGSPPWSVTVKENVFIVEVFAGPLPGEGSSPSYSAARVVSVIIHLDGTFEYRNEDFRLDLGGVSYGVARTPGAQSIDPSGTGHWWNRWI
jgi:hypothetical protein